MIKVENINKTFNPRSSNRNRVLKDVSFDLPDQGLVAIFGKSGSGKTTLLNIIGGLEKQDSGKIYIDGECTSGKTDEIRNRKIGFIFQNYYLENGTVEDIMRNQMLIAGFKDENEIKQRSVEALTLVDMERYKHKFGDALSGGQKQRVAIARAVIKGCDVILADEPTGNLDYENTHKVMEILKKISENHLVVLVTHELTLIKDYADSYVELVDGEITHDTTLAEQLKGLPENKKEINYNIPVPVFEKSTEKHNGRLFNLKSVLKSLKNDGSEKAYSAANIFKQIFILAMAVVLCFFAFSVFEITSLKIENKTLQENSLYTSLSAYSEIRRMDESKYESIDFFDTQMREGDFSYHGISALSGIKMNYTPRAIKADASFSDLVGRMPEEGEILISRALAERLKNEFRIDEIKNDRSVLLVEFEGEFSVSGIVSGNEPYVYMNKGDYVNFLGVYDRISFSDIGQVFFKDTFGSVSYTALIRQSENTLDNDKAVIEINRNSLYKMMSDTTQADYSTEKANIQLVKTPYAIQISGSKLYVEKFQITRDVMTSDIIVYVNENVLNNIFVYLSPNLDALGGENSQYCFEISAGKDGVAQLKSELRDRGISTVDVDAVYARENAEILEDAKSGLNIFYIVIVLLYLVYFLIEKSGSIKSSKEYGVYRAIGVNKSNLLFKEFLTAIISNIVSYFIFSIIATLLISVRYAVMNVAFGGFIGLAAAVFAVSAALMTAVSIVPYLFVLYMPPARILARYDI